MAASGYTPILLYASGTTTNVPLAANMTSSASGAELALNYADGKLYYKDSGGTVQVLATKGAAQNSISFGTTGLTPNTATQGAVTVAGTLNVTNGGTGATTLTGYVYGNGTGAMTASTTIPTSSLSGTINLATQVTGTLPVGNGGTGLTTLTAGYIPYGNGTSAFSSSANMTFNGTTLTLANDASISGLTVGKGGGSVSTNTVVGASALNTNTTSGQSVAVGYQALYTSNYTSGNANNTAVGYNAGYATTTGIQNTFVGQSSGTSNTTGGQNSFFGYGSGVNSTTGSSNTGIGFQALASNTTASNNTAVGYQAGYSGTTAQNNTFIGYQAGYTSNPTGTPNNGNTCIGFQAGYSLTTGTANSFIGGTNNSPCGYYVTTGSKNTILGGYNGNQGGLDIRTSSNYIVLSDGDGNPRGYFDSNGKFNVTNSSAGTDLFLATASSSSFTQVTYRSDSATAAGTGWSHFYGTSSSNTVSNVSIRGNGNLQNANNSYAGYSDIKLKENITDATPKLADLMQVKIRNYTFKVGENHKQLGVIAQEVEQIFPSIVEETPDLDKDGHPNGEYTKSVKYSIFVPMLIKAIQELKAEFDAYKATHP